MNNSNSPQAQANKRALFCLGCFLTPIVGFFGLGLLAMGINAVIPDATPTPVPIATTLPAPTPRPTMAPTRAPTPKPARDKPLAAAALDNTFVVQEPKADKPRKKRPRRTPKPRPTRTPRPTVESDDFSSGSSKPSYTDRAPDEQGGACTTGATAVCNDGSTSYAANHRGACSHHGGVAQWCD